MRRLQEGRQMPNTEQLLYQTQKKKTDFYKNAVLKSFAIFTGKIPWTFC